MLDYMGLLNFERPSSETDTEEMKIKMRRKVEEKKLELEKAMQGRFIPFVDAPTPLVALIATYDLLEGEWSIVVGFCS
jgi:hypothetical protein